MNTAAVIFGSAPSGRRGAAGRQSSGRKKIRLAFLRALRTFIQGIAGAFPAAGAGTVILDATYWETVGYSILAAGIAAVVSFLQNAASFLPEDPSQKDPDDGN